jgi:hypothetical protein
MSNCVQHTEYLSPLRLIGHPSGCKSQDSAGEIGRAIWVGKQSENTDFQQGTARRILGFTLMERLQRTFSTGWKVFETTHQQKRVMEEIIR